MPHPWRLPSQGGELTVVASGDLVVIDRATIARWLDDPLYAPSLIALYERTGGARHEVTSARPARTVRSAVLPSLAPLFRGKGLVASRRIRAYVDPVVADEEPAPAAPPRRATSAPIADEPPSQPDADWMTVSYMLDTSDEVDAEYPKYVLTSADGSYRKELSPRHDLVPGDHYLQLRFDGLHPGLTYTLVRQHDVDYEETIFVNLPFETIVDQDRPLHARLERHDYGDFDLMDTPTYDVEPWN